MHLENERMEKIPTDSGSAISLEPDGVFTNNGQKTDSISYGEVMASAWNTFRSRVFKLLSIILIPYIALLLGALSIFGLYYYINTNPEILQEVIISMFSTGLPPQWLLINIVAIVLVTFIAWIMMQAWSMAAMITMSLSHDAIGVKKAFKEARSIYWKFFAVAAAVGLFVFFYLPLLIIPGIVIGVYFSIAMQVFIAERVSVKQSLLRSYTYIRGNFWKVLALVASWAVVSMVVGTIFDVFVDNLEPGIVLLVAGILRFVFSILMTTFFVCMSASMYKAIKEKKHSITVNTKISYFVYPTILGLAVYVVLAVLAFQEFSERYMPVISAPIQ